MLRFAEHALARGEARVQSLIEQALVRPWGPDPAGACSPSCRRLLAFLPALARLLALALALARYAHFCYTKVRK